MQVFADILTQGIRQKILPAKTQIARDWYRNTAKKIKRLNQTSLIRQAGHRDYSFVTKAEAIDEKGHLRDGYETVQSGNLTRYRREERIRLVDRPLLGNMYMFHYDAKHKDTLPYWDMYPLIFPFRKVKGGFLGINLHYLPPQLRAKLMDGLYSLANNKKYTETTRLKLSYALMSQIATLRYFKPCVHHYLTGHVKSRLVYIHPTEWDIALMLPTQKFIGATNEQVWKDSRNKVL